jgi:predicted transcriptional regulator
MQSVKSKLSRLELYMEILRSLEKLRCSNLLTIQEETNVEQAFLEQAMAFLEKQDLVEKENIANETFYKTTPRGSRVNRYFSQAKVPQEDFNFA